MKIKLTNSLPPVIVFGLGINGLSVVRNLAKNGIKVYGVTSDPQDVGLFSRYCEPVFVDGTLDNFNKTLIFLRKFAEKINFKAVLFATTDSYVSFLSENRKELENLFYFCLPFPKTIENIIDKRRFYCLATDLNIACPKTFFCNDIRELEAIAGQVNYPCLIKPAFPSAWRKKYNDSKLIEINSREELIKKYPILKKDVFDLMIQEIVKGLDTQIYFYYAYFNNQHKPLASLVIRKLRQLPINYGVGSLIESVYEPKIADLSNRLLKSINYRGFADIEFKKDTRDGIFKLIELNVRTPMNGEIAIGSGIDLPYIAYCDIIGKSLDNNITTYKTGIKWIGFEMDLESFFEYRRRNELNFVNWIRSLLGKKVYAYFRWDDIIPFVVSFLRFNKRIMKKATKLSLAKFEKLFISAKN